MAYNALKTLSTGQAHATASAIYTGPTAGKSTEVGMLWLHNAGGSSLQVRAYWQENATASLRFNETLASNETYEISPKIPIIISGTGSFFLVAANSSSINYYLVGREET